MSAQNQIYKLSSHQISTSLSGESVILNHKKGEYYSLNEVGTLVWEKLKSAPHSFKDLTKAIIENFETSENECIIDLEKLLSDLINENLIEIVE